MVCCFVLCPAYAIGDHLDSYPLGFLVVGGIYLLATGLLVRDKIVEGPLLEKFSNFLTTKPWELKNIHHTQIDRELEILKIEKK
jgi:cytochrome c biogenesis protein CcdA